MTDDTQPPHSEETRASILDQLAYLAREADALEQIIGEVPDAVLTERPPSGDDWSIKETFALLARLDEAVYPRWVERIASEDEPRLDPPDEEALLAAGDDGADWNAHDITNLMERVQEARKAFVGMLQELPPRMWKREAIFGDGDDPDRRDVYAITRDVVRRDYDRLRRMTRRLHESELSAAGHDVPR